MRAYLLQRLGAMGLTLFGVSLLVFGMVRLIPGTVVEQLLGQAAMSSPEVVASFRRFFGLDQPVHVQYLAWLGGLLRGDLGVSWLSGRPVLGLFLERLPVSAELAMLAVGWSLLVGIPLGTASAVWGGGARDGVIRVAATLGLSLPAFWQGAVLITADTGCSCPRTRTAFTCSDSTRMASTGDSSCTVASGSCSASC